VDRNARRPGLWLQFGATRPRWSLCQRRCPGQVCHRLRWRLDQGHERRSVRSAL